MWIVCKQENINNHQTVEHMLVKSENEVYRQSYQMLTKHKKLMGRSVIY